MPKNFQGGADMGGDGGADFREDGGVQDVDEPVPPDDGALHAKVDLLTQRRIPQSHHHIHPLLLLIPELEQLIQVLLHTYLHVQRHPRLLHHEQRLPHPHPPQRRGGPGLPERLRDISDQGAEGAHAHEHTPHAVDPLSHGGARDVPEAHGGGDGEGEVEAGDEDVELVEVGEPLGLDPVQVPVPRGGDLGGHHPPPAGHERRQSNQTESQPQQGQAQHAPVAHLRLHRLKRPVQLGYPHHAEGAGDFQELGGLHEPTVPGHEALPRDHRQKIHQEPSLQVVNKDLPPV
mmetsp:Transcript_36127/g.94610  ORF Transcript_36127/g.94610 Transcript_36127/m.94610 type:complete len:289 (-) Transcript_36127:459-1325(-)